MTSPAYAWIYEEPFHTIYVASTTTLSVLSNGLLLFIIVTTSSSSSNIGSYRYLLAVFAVCDVITSFAHATFQPIMHLTSTGLYFFSRTSKIIGGESYETLCATLFVCSYYQTFIVLAFHFVYRTNVATSGITRSFTDSWEKSQWTSLAVALYNALYISGYALVCIFLFAPSDETRGLAPSEINEIYGVNLRNLSRGFLVVAVKRPNSERGSMEWNLNSSAGLMIFFTLTFLTILTIVICI